MHILLIEDNRDLALNLYDYLQARASGALGPGRPPWSGK